jgi:hypothetical protein
MKIILHGKTYRFLKKFHVEQQRDCILLKEHEINFATTIDSSLPGCFRLFIDDKKYDQAVLILQC